MSEPTGPTGPIDPTRPMPAAQQPPTQPQPAVTQAEPTGSAGQPAGSQTLPPKGPNLWRQATSTTGGTIALIVASVLTLLLVVGVLGLGAAAVVRTVADHGGDRGDRMEQMREGRNGDLPPGQQRRLEKGQGGGQLPGNGNGNGKDKDKSKDKPDAEAPNGLGGLGMGSMMSGVGALGDVQHGEFTTQDSTGKAVVMTVQRGTVTAASATSVTVRSADGFSATYAVDDSTRGRAGAVAKDDSVLVVAQKAGSKAVVIRAVRSS